jgi:hypothetical protein
MYIAQAFCHSLIAAVIIDRALKIWDITNPLIKQRFLFISVIFPTFSFPMYQMINPERGSISFRLESVFDTNRWLNLELFGKVPLSLFFVLILFFTALVFFIQEMIPIWKHAFKSQKVPPGIKEDDDYAAVVNKALADLPVEKPDIFIIDDDRFVLFSRTDKNAAIFLSTGLINVLNTEQIQAAIAHEIAHIARNKKPLLMVVFLFRTLMFFNPVVLLEFRRIVHEEEKICDDIAVSITQKPDALAETLKNFYHEHEDSNLAHMKTTSTIGTTIEDSHNMLLKSRVKRLQGGQVHNNSNSEWLPFIITLAAIVLINYFVV